MNRFGPLTLTSIAVMSLVFTFSSAAAVGQEKSLKEQLVGTWTYVSVDIVHPDGSRVPMYGPNLTGLAVFDGNGRYILMTARPGQPKFASNKRTEGTRRSTSPLCMDRSLTSADIP